MQKEKYSLCLLLRFDQILLRKEKIIRLLHEKNKNQISSSCYDFGPGQWSHCTLEIKEVWKQKEK